MSLVAGEVWLMFVDSDSVPESWRERVRPISGVRLLDEEVQLIGVGAEWGTQLDPQDLQLAVLVARGTPVGVMAKRLEMSIRTVQRRLSGLRKQFGVTSTVELAGRLAERGFARWNGENGG